MNDIEYLESAVVDIFSAIEKMKNVDNFVNYSSGMYTEAELDIVTTYEDALKYIIGGIRIYIDDNKE